ncbi:helix-turn-helix domain-containing protein [archaeon]|nr:helix-turn-helix domain-containing protein [archaeon]
MAEDNIEEETYSLIFTSLKHPIRRRILRMLADKPLTYSEILETHNIDSGHLSYHLENLGDLTVHSNNGHYKLSSFGVAAVKLMGGVEEHTPQPKRKFKPWRLLAKVYPIILALALIGASFHLVTYATVVSTTTTSTELLYPLYSNIPLNLSADETFEVNATIEHRSPIYGHGFGVSGSFQEWTFWIPRLESTLTGWDEATIWLDSQFNLTTLLTPFPPQVVPVTVWNEASQANKTINVTVGGYGSSVDPNVATDPLNLEVETYTPEGAMLTDNFYRTGQVPRIDTTSSLPIAITQEGTYNFKITNKGSWDWNGFLTVNLQFQHVEKPYFYWGIVGFAIALGYIALVTITVHKTRHKNDDE